MPVKLNAYPAGEVPLEPVIPQIIANMRKNYSTKLPEPNTESGWVSIYELMEFISDNKGNGVRIYFGRHDEKHPNYKNQNTVILVATRDTVNPNDPTTENSVDLLNAYEAKGEVNSVILSTGYEGKGGDTIPLCPPRCPPPTRI